MSGPIATPTENVTGIRAYTCARLDSSVISVNLQSAINVTNSHDCECNYIVLIKPAFPLSIPAKNRLVASWENVRDSPKKSIAKHRPVKPNLATSL